MIIFEILYKFYISFVYYYTFIKKIYKILYNTILFNIKKIKSNKIINLFFYFVEISIKKKIHLLFYYFFLLKNIKLSTHLLMQMFLIKIFQN